MRKTDSSRSPRQLEFELSSAEPLVLNAFVPAVETPPRSCQKSSSSGCCVYGFYIKAWSLCCDSWLLLACCGRHDGTGSARLTGQLFCCCYVIVCYCGRRSWILSVSSHNFVSTGSSGFSCSADSRRVYSPFFSVS